MHVNVNDLSKKCQQWGYTFFPAPRKGKINVEEGWGRGGKRNRLERGMKGHNMCHSNVSTCAMPADGWDNSVNGFEIVMRSPGGPPTAATLPFPLSFRYTAGRIPKRRSTSRPWGLMCSWVCATAAHTLTMTIQRVEGHGNDDNLGEICQLNSGGKIWDGPRIEVD